MSKKIALTIDDRLYEKLSKHARKNDESVQDFLIRAVCDALDMWEDFYNEADTLSKKEDHPKVTFFANNQKNVFKTVYLTFSLRILKSFDTLMNSIEEKLYDVQK